MKIDYTRYYKRWHADTAEHQAAMSARYRAFIAPHLPPDTSAPVLDVGCGMGFAIAALTEWGYRNVMGLEVDAGQALVCREKGLAVTQCDDTIAALRPLRERFAFILCMDVIEHVPVDAQPGFVRAMAEALTTGGRLLCSVPNASSALAGRWRYDDWTHASSFSERSLGELLRLGGLGPLRITALESFHRPAHAWLPRRGVRHWWAFRFFRAIRRLEVMAELGAEKGLHVPLSLNLMAVAEKALADPRPLV